MTQRGITIGERGEDAQVRFRQLQRAVLTQCPIVRVGIGAMGCSKHIGE